ncbi:BTAD domain-containing putative transcriptional regulator [Spirillospora sp. CA-255316]
MRFGVLGPLEVWTGCGRTVRIPELKVRLLLAVLLAADGRPVSSGRLIEDLWGTEPPGKPAAALRVKVSQLRRALEEAEPGGRGLVESGPAGYLLKAGDVDARSFQALTAKARRTGDPASRAALLNDALALWRGPAFADFGEDAFARAGITRLEEERLTALEELAEARLALGEHHALIAELSALAERHPLRERIQASLMRALYRAGRQHDALEGYRRLRARLRDDLGLDPSPELDALHQAILRQDPALRAPAAPPARARAHLPVPPDELIGRDAEAEKVVEALAGASRLVTLTGPGGVGKTRLALEAAARARGSFPDGTFWVELAGLPRDTTSPEGVAEAVAAAMGIRGDASDGVVEELADRRALLVLDNCEHVIEPVAKLVDGLLRSGPGPRILATAREPLGLSGELLRVVPPLEPPPDGEIGEHDPEALRRAASVRLFEARASAAAPGFALDRGNAADVAAICRRLDGIPLALELAAARVRALGTAQLAARLDDRFRLLGSGRRGLPERQRTLRAAIDWSWEPLDGTERAVLRRLAVHAAACTLDAAEEICSGDGVEQAEVVDAVARLVDRSLVVVADGPDGPRYRLLESVAAYALERLGEAGERERVQHRHDEYYTLVAECAEVFREGHARRRWLARLDADTANLRAAMESATRRGQDELARRLTRALAWYWIERGRTGEAGRSLWAALTESADAHRLDGLAATLRELAPDPG